MSQHRILLVEDSPEFQLVVKAALQSQYVVKTVGTYSEAMKEIENETYSLLILDVELPDGNGFKICAQAKMIERNRNVPIIFLSGKYQTSDKVMALSLGADDYIVKPFEQSEFQARINARIRRLEETRQSQDKISVGPFTIVASQQKASIHGEVGESQLNFTTIEFKIFHFLMRNQDHVFSREQILNEVWGQATNVSDRTVDTHIYTIRQKLGKNSGVIQSIPRAGYRFSQVGTKAA